MKHLIFVFFDSYKVQTNPKKLFKVGRVFVAIWHEGMGNAAPLRGGTKSLASDHELMTVGKFGTRIYTDIRRMVVFNEMDQCAWCFLVHTYGRLGVAKASVNPSNHAAIYMEDQQPRYGLNEPKTTKETIEVTPEPYQRLHAMSGLDFGKFIQSNITKKFFQLGPSARNP
ncbi:hypothetical protein BDV27DRAFT_159687 [Aspergillus caelatus]|uniref:DUF6590 domain-containing protein n=1 Tax=Aspergillus caelatus TaxID=61420 RepID=A0A5N6ZY63_9EURO|nr:uncharacterized protein BDV27DRAFT_159687 [Aspergillus caelatus]KAE8362541.1 hypothetical protein BDV27DRAFT_159687 [Aspergillus caelatus]